MNTKIAEALSNNDLKAAKDLLLEQFRGEVGDRRGWSSPHYDPRIRPVHAGIVLRPEADGAFTYMGLENVRERYVLRDASGVPCESPQDMYARVAAGTCGGDPALAQRLYDAMSRHWYSPSTPILHNAGTLKGLTISCFLNSMPDTLEGIYDTYKESAFLAKYGGGIGTDFSRLRGAGSRLVASGLESSGIVPFLKVFDSSTIAVARNGVRRGAAAAYLRVDHPEIMEFLELRKPAGDPDRRALNINHGVTVTDAFMEAVGSNGEYDLIDPHYGTVAGTLKARDVWRRLLMVRAETGEPYVLFLDTVNRAVPASHKEKGLLVTQSNLCSEITLPTDDERTAVCCLSSLNLEKYDEWSGAAAELVADVVTSLDNNIDLFLRDARPEHAKAVFSARSERSVGLGVMGYHGYLMSKGWPFESLAARSWNKTVFRRIGTLARAASEELGASRGPAPDGGTRRNTYVTAIAPTASISFICGEATPGIEPLSGNAYVQKTLSGSFLMKNKHLEGVLESKGKNDDETWAGVIRAKGSVHGLECLGPEEKAVFRTAYEMNQRELVQQAADRQPHVDQSQSLNLFFPAPVSGKYLNAVHEAAWKSGVKSLYYLRSESQSADAPARDLANEECTVCQ